MKKPLPIWSVVAAIGAAAVMVFFVFTKSGAGEPNRDELMKIRGNMRAWGGGGQTPHPRPGTIAEGSAQPGTVAPPELHDSSVPK